MGKALAETFPAARAVFDEVDAALGEKLSRGHVGRAGRDADAHRERAAGADGGVARRDARARSRSRRRSRARRQVRRRSFARRIFGAGRGRRADDRPTRCGSCASAAAPCRRRCRSAPARWRRCSASISSRRRRSPPRPRRARSCQAANDNGGGQVVVSGHKAAVERAVEIAKAKGARRAMLLPVSAPFHCALMQPAADVMAEALAKVTIKPPVRAGGRQCARREPVTDPARDRARPGRAGHRHRALARVGRLHGRGRASPHSTKSERARCCPVWSSGSPTVRAAWRSARRTTSPRSRPQAVRG